MFNTVFSVELGAPTDLPSSNSTFWEKRKKTNPSISKSLARPEKVR